MKLKLMLALGAAMSLCATGAFADKKGTDKDINNTRGSTKNVDLPQCAQSLGSVSITDGDGHGWTAYNLGAPSVLLKAFVQRSGCFTLVDRGAGMSALQKEQALAAGGDLQKGSNVGAGQVKAADYVLVADIANTDSNAGGSGVAGVAGGLIGGRVGGVLGGIKTKRVEAQTVLTLMNVRTSEIQAAAEGSASKKDISFGGGGGYAFAGAIGGGYQDTEVGKVVTYAFLDAYRQIVGQLGGLPEDAADAAPKEAFIVSVDSVTMRRSPSSSSSAVRDLEEGAMVYPLGGKEEMWWEVEDENGNVGWIENDKLEPAK
jgi:curli biogenesis system outer membrane secretion channel CsgG